VLVENGGTVVIGGIFELTETDSETKVPVLGDLPVVGNLFKTRSRTGNAPTSRKCWCSSRPR
jgi:type IV pilus assembly protein PilQ